MVKESDLTFKKVTQDDVQPLTAIMTRAFNEDTRRHLGREVGGPPGYDTGEFVQKWYIESEAKSYTIWYQGKMIGGYGVFINPDKVNFLGNVFVDTSCQDHGFGTVIWEHIQKEYPDTIKWCTETPAFSKRNHNFYINKCGFKVVRIADPKDPDEAMYIMEKEMK